MAGGQKPWYSRLREAVEACEKLDDPDLFSALVGVVLKDVDRPWDLLAQAADFTYHQQKHWIKGWADGAIMPTPSMRRKVVRNLREHFGQAFRGP
jgi:hypothetical protein